MAGILENAKEGIVENSKDFSRNLQRRSDETFQDINTSPSKTGNPDDALRPDLQEGPLADKVGGGGGADARVYFVWNEK